MAGNREWMAFFASMWSGIPAERDHAAEPFIAADALKRAAECFVALACAGGLRQN
jgi:hypothetical protein